MNRLRFYGGVGIFAAMIGVLLTLGFWQLARLEWKNSLLAARGSALSLPPRVLTNIDDLPSNYSRLIIRGSFMGGTETRWLGRFDGEQSGIEVLQAFKIPRAGAGAKSQEAIIWVNRGFIANGATGAIAEIPLLGSDSPTEVMGWLMPRPKAGAFTPQNHPEQNLWYWPDLASLCDRLVLTSPCIEEHYLLLHNQSPPAPADRIKIVKNLPELVNNHLQYAITWFSLALILVVVFVFLVRRGLIRAKN
ncbi:MAG: SURF1 family cytochrome oxidase biogenesis protein [Candidatus Pacebacteria bacterium]|nr:SURF1 family cytochrome oxidase biogenesis protein [Candidatus Paceibacterota bacterium]